MLESTFNGENSKYCEKDKKIPETYDLLYAQRKMFIDALLTASRNTPHGSKFMPEQTPRSYEEFAALPIITGDDIKQSSDEEYVTLPGTKDGGEEYFAFSSGGTTSRPKRIVRSRQVEWVELPTVFDDFMNSQEHPVLIHKNGRGAFYEYIGERLQRYRNLDVEPYESLDDFIVSCNNSDAPYYMDLVGAFRELFYEIKKSVSSNPEQFKALAEKRFYLDLSGSKVDTGEIQEWYDTLSHIFKKGVFIDITYGLTETGEFGTYFYKKGDKEPKYKIKQDTFIEVLGKNNEPLIGQEGRVVATRFLEGKGTILPRYETGDLGTLEVASNGDVYLVNPHRNPERGMLDVFGQKIFVGDIYDILADKIEVPFKLLTESKMSPGNDKIFINIDIYTKKEIHNQDSLKNLLMGAILFNNSFLLDLISKNKAEININLINSENPNIKDWSIRKDQ